MRRSIVLLSSLLFIVGCGAFNKKDINDEKVLEDNQRVDLTATNGTYDLADYLFPKENHIYEYEISTKSQVNGIVSNIPYLINRDDVYTIDGKEVILNKNLTYFINEYIIRRIELINNFKYQKEYRRYIDINDSYESFEDIDVQKNYLQIGQQFCRLEKHFNNLEVLNKKYTDVIHLICFGDFRRSSVDFREQRKFQIDGLYVKGQGLIKEILDENITNTYGDEQYNRQSYKTTILKTILQ